jgi:hypothetical protein
MPGGFNRHFIGKPYLAVCIEAGEVIAGFWINKNRGCQARFF